MDFIVTVVIFSEISVTVAEEIIDKYEFNDLEKPSITLFRLLVLDLVSGDYYLFSKLQSILDRSRCSRERKTTNYWKYYKRRLHKFRNKIKEKIYRDLNRGVHLPNYNSFSQFSCHR